MILDYVLWTCHCTNEDVPRSHSNHTIILQLNVFRDSMVTTIISQLNVPRDSMVTTIISQLNVLRDSMVTTLFILQLKMFHDPTVTTLQQLDNLHLKSPSDKSHVFTVISQNIPLLPKVSSIRIHILYH